MTLPQRDKRTYQKPLPIGGVVDRLLTSLGLVETRNGWSIVSQWSEIVGEHYARNSEAFRYAEGVLYVAVKDASWRQTMSMDREKILQIIHGLPHGKVIREIHLVRDKKGS